MRCKSSERKRGLQAYAVANQLVSELGLRGFRLQLSVEKAQGYQGVGSAHGQAAENRLQERLCHCYLRDDFLDCARQSRQAFRVIA